MWYWKWKWLKKTKRTSCNNVRYDFKDKMAKTETFFAFGSCLKWNFLLSNLFPYCEMHNLSSWNVICVWKIPLYKLSFHNFKYRPWNHAFSKLTIYMLKEHQQENSVQGEESGLDFTDRYFALVILFPHYIISTF